MILEYLLLSLYLGIILILITTYLLYPIFSKKFLRSYKKVYLHKDIGTSYVIIPAYNEENVIEEKVLNTLENMGEKGMAVIVSDSSNDDTDIICKRIESKNERVLFLVNKKRGGKNTCLNHAVEILKPNQGDILIFTDCNTFFDDQSLPEIRKSLLDGASLAAGSMVYDSMKSDSAVSEGLYWRYEEWLRKNESEKGRLIVCNGGLFGMWAEYFKKLPPFVPNDLEGPLRLCGEGKYVEINPLARGYERAINSASEEYTRKHRMANRQMNCILFLWRDINIGTKLQVIFHKLFRWFGLHLFIISTLLIIIINRTYGSNLISLLVGLHICTLALMLLSWFNSFLKLENRFLPKIYHACKVHIYGARGAIKAILGNKTSIWEKASTNRL